MNSVTGLEKIMSVTKAWARGGAEAVNDEAPD